jgi:hypothetical protein
MISAKKAKEIAVDYCTNSNVYRELAGYIECAALLGQFYLEYQCVGIDLNQITQLAQRLQDDGYKTVACRYLSESIINTSPIPTKEVVFSLIISWK